MKTILKPLTTCQIRRFSPLLKSLQAQDEKHYYLQEVAQITWTPCLKHFDFSEKLTYLHMNVDGFWILP